MEPRADTVRIKTDADRSRAGDRSVPAEARSWAPTADAARVAAADWGWPAPPIDNRPTFTHNAARYSRPAEAPTPVEHLDLEPELSPPPRWMMMVAGAAVAALIGALLGGLMHI
ncbi:MAG: hypothetical protein P0Y50_09475 [Candidatus Brevundimonas colombiensis]|uniref:Uncharacterized protein n=1 Tax=Candidatus Brevundimonas colombiensis TaxID=3121376 RepID=A0AAJ6BIG0_9CAUL|nr:hypothetical protein [Brevundimonas sp.]WEK38780.1 MAG: hypothetical protein P0Y50_09475 [Brevundimonas sp.]